jgi:hypothetical protein
MSSLSLAIQAVKDKIALSAGTATPEELAYLGTALDRIGGRATVYEVVDTGDVKKAELTALAEQLFAAIETDTTEELAAFVAAVDAKVATMTTSVGILVETSIQNIVDAKNETEASFNDAKAEADAAAAALSSSAAIAQQQALNGSMYINHFFASIR